MVCVHNELLLIKKKEILPVMTTWMDLEGFMLDERRQKKRKTR